uniref:protein-tyrosine-phosphatase n=1 Tax=Culicoides sonorensis TaxID=179676 RepID=A0A336L4J4_CULSO
MKRTRKLMKIKIFIVLVVICVFSSQIHGIKATEYDQTTSRLFDEENLESVSTDDLYITTPYTENPLRKFNHITSEPNTRAQPIVIAFQDDATSSTEIPNYECGAVRNPIYTLDETKISIQWSPPNNPEKCNGTYVVQLIDNDNEAVISNLTTSDTSVEFLNLESCGSYRFEINSFDLAGNPGESNEKFFKTETVIPSPVINLKYNSTSSVESQATSVTIQWEEPKSGKKCVKEYEVLMWRRDRESEEEDPNIISSNITSRTITQLELTACEIYVVQVTAIVNASIRGVENKITMTMAARLTVAPSKTERESYGQHFLNLSTTNNDIKSVCFPSLAMFTCTYEGNDTEVEKELIKEVLVYPDDEKYYVVFEDLLPYTKYECNAKLYNVMGWSASSLINGVHLTDEDIPDRPTDVFVNETKPNSFRVSWDAPERANGILNYYRLYIRMIKPLYIIPDSCGGIRTINISHTEPATVYTRIVDELNAYVQYSVQVAASNNKGVGDYSDTIFIETKAAPSDAVNNLNFNVTVPTSVNEYNAIYTFMWDIPCRTNGLLKGFRLRAEGTRQNYDTHLIDITIQANENDTFYLYDVEDFKPSYGYNMTVTPVTGPEVANERNKISFIYVLTVPGVPKANNFSNWGYLDTSTAPNPTQSVQISISRRIMKSDEGEISWYAILLSEIGCQEDPEPKNGVLSPGIDWPDVLSWHDVQDKECIPQYQTTPKRLSVGENEFGPILYTIGTSDCTNDPNYCNGPLKPGTKYAVIVRIFTETGYSDTQMMVFETDRLIALLLIITLITALLSSGFLIGLLVLYKKGMFEPSPGLTILPGIDEINGKNFIERYNEMTANKNERLIKEYKTIDADTAILENYSFNAARQNSGKNRYSNIHPFDHNRVVLKMDDGDSDYINASYIDGFKQEREYIACQGPKPETCNDFWRMILENKVESIVMLTSFKEGNKIKCAEYFPNNGDFRYYDDIIVRCQDELSFSTYKKRKFFIEKGEETTEVQHYHFFKWLDHDCPKYPNELIKFVKQVRCERKVQEVPLVVHCSAGVGRTGTFIALDIIMQKIKEEKRLNIYEIVKQLRMQRVKMVQTPGQYIYLYKCVYELMIKEKNWTQRLIEKLTKTPEKQEIVDEEKSDCNTILGELSPLPNGKKTENGHINNTESHI